MKNFSKCLLSITLSLILFSSLINLSIQDINDSPTLMELYNIRQIRKGINSVTPEVDSNVVVEMKVYDKDNKKLVMHSRETLLQGSKSHPKCIEFTLIYMNIQERIVLDCPADKAFRSDYVNKNRFNGVLPNTSYIIDFQVWAIGDGAIE